MNKNTLKITTGAMFIAIFAVLLLINRQTGMMFEELILYLLPIPMVAYSATYGLKSGVPVMIAMGLISLFFGTLTTIFYAVTEAFIGLVFGACLYHKADATKTLFAVIALSAIANVLNTVVLASVFGYDLATEIAEMQNMLTTTFAKTGMQIPEGILNTNYLMRIMVISMVLLGVVQGYVIYTISLLILRRLRYPVQRPKSLLLFFPPKWTGYLGLLFLFAPVFSAAYTGLDSTMTTVLQTCAICATLYFMAFGYIGVLLLVKVYVTKRSFIGMILAIAALLLASQIVMIIGIMYIVSNSHQRLLDRLIAS